MDSQDVIYQKIGEFAVTFQWIENRLREIGWLILDPDRSEWPPKTLRNLTNQKLIDKVAGLIREALQSCDLMPDLEADFGRGLDACVRSLHELRKDRNRILHSAFIELKAGGEVHAILRSNPKIEVDEETGEVLFDQECLTSSSFDNEMRRMADVAMFLNRVYIQLIHRYPNGGTQQADPADRASRGH